MATIVEAARAQLAGLDAKREKLLKIIELAESLDEPRISRVDNRRAKPPVRGPSQATLKTYDAARVVLLEHGKPMRLSALLAGVTARGVEVGGKKPAYTLAARLSNSKEFKSQRNGAGWWFTDKPLPQVGTQNKEAEGNPSQDQPSASNLNQGERYAPALAE